MRMICSNFFILLFLFNLLCCVVFKEKEENVKFFFLFLMMQSEEDENDTKTSERWWFILINFVLFFPLHLKRYNNREMSRGFEQHFTYYLMAIDWSLSSMMRTKKTQNAIPSLWIRVSLTGWKVTWTCSEWWFFHSFSDVPLIMIIKTEI
jgi:hypothetical protein